MTSPERISVVGTGLIGTSIAMAALRADSPVVGFDADRATLDRAASYAGFDASSSLNQCVRDADLVFICTPIPTVGTLAARALVEAPTTVVSDVGSVKSRVVGEVEALLAASADRGAGSLARFVGGHPMGGSERSGPEGASPSVVDGIVWVVTPTEHTDPERVERLEAWIERIGARPIRMDPARHDRLVAMVSHLPQVASTALMALAATEEAGEPEILLLAAGGFRDLTRLAASSPSLWSDILVANREAVVRAIDLYRDRLSSLRDLVMAADAGRVEEAFDEAKRARLTLAAKPQVRSGVAVIQVPVPDRPGALAELTACLGDAGVNIEDLQIVHSPEGGRGVVHVTVAAAAAGEASRALAGSGLAALRLA